MCYDQYEWLNAFSLFTGCCLYHFIQSCNLLVNVNIVCVYYNGAEGMANQYAKPKAKVLDAFTQPANLNPIGLQQT